MTPMTIVTITARLANATILLSFSARFKHSNVPVPADEAGMHTASLTPAIYAEVLVRGP